MYSLPFDFQERAQEEMQEVQKDNKGQGQAEGDLKNKILFLKCLKLNIPCLLQFEPLSELLTPALPDVSIPRTPSPFAVFAAVRATCLENKQRQGRA